MPDQVPVLVQPAASALTQHRRPLNALTGIRFFAAFYVVIFHSRVGQALHDAGHTAAGNFFFNGFLAVPLFFLLSGFILAYTYEGQIAKAGDYRRFWEARFARIWPVYALSLLLAAVPGLHFPKPLQTVAALFMVQAWNPWNSDMAGAGNFVCWTLSVEALFYVCFPSFQTWLDRRSSRSILLLIGGMIALCILVNSSSRTLGYPAHGVARYVPLPVWHLPEFFTGVGLGNYFLRRLSLQTVRPGTHALPGGGLWTYAAAALTVALLCRPAGRMTSVIVLAFALLIYGLAAERTLLSRVLSTKTMLLGGGISYSIYLMQMPVKFWVQLVADRLHLHSQNLRLGLNAALLLLLSLILFKAVENPARKALRSMFAAIEFRRQTAGRAALRREATQ